MKIEIIAAGRLKKGPFFDLSRDYLKRLQWPLTLHEIESRYKDPREIQADEHEKIVRHLKPSSYLVALDEKGKTLRSLEFARTIEKLQTGGQGDMQFVIGGADGLLDDLKARAKLLLSFGAPTWPHMLARVMLLEQIYRAQQILSGHPYHRE